SAISYQLSAISYQLSAISYQMSDVAGLNGPYRPYCHFEEERDCFGCFGRLGFFVFCQSTQMNQAVDVD
ncbi:MAG TPA: hypothetical protein PLI09_08190, partial [Candidatus Hydrogenedentes bacterium]|nr:hypothetical protein [Candidatus Hydrogenedentota bacterium]